MSKLTINGQPPELHLKSRADLVRALHIPGVLISVVEHWLPELVATTRTPKARRNKSGRPGIQTNGYWFDSPNLEGKIVEMWAELPKASELRFNHDGTVTFYPAGPKSWTLRFAEGGQ
jgi:hypothetical protein